MCLLGFRFPPNPTPPNPEPTRKCPSGVLHRGCRLRSVQAINALHLRVESVRFTDIGMLCSRLGAWDLGLWESGFGRLRIKKKVP